VGEVDDQQYSCLLIGDWLNPGLALCNQEESIFEEQISVSIT
jgi:hypothetical protein